MDACFSHVSYASDTHFLPVLSFESFQIQRMLFFLQIQAVNCVIGKD